MAPGWVLVSPSGDRAPLQPLMGERLRLASAAPEMVRALLLVEWNGGAGRGDCSDCEADRYLDGGHHASDCDLDAALTKAGFPDQVSRDAGRKEMG